MVQECIKRRFVVGKLVDNRWHEHRRIEEYAHLLPALPDDPPAARVSLRPYEIGDVDCGATIAVMHQDPLLCHQCRRRFDLSYLQAFAVHIDLQLGSGQQVQLLAEAFRDDDASSGVNGNNHGMMVFSMDFNVNGR